MSMHHSTLTRLAHGSLAIAVGTYLLTGLVLQVPSDQHSGNVFFTIHNDAGLAVAGLVVMFWGVIATRRRGSDPGLLFPWASRARLADLADDLRRHWVAFRFPGTASARVPSPLAAASHGLGLLLVTAMAGTGLDLQIASPSHLTDAGGTPWLLWSNDMLGLLVGAYFVGHGVTAVLMHYAGHADLAAMWAPGPTVPRRRTGTE